MKSTSLARIVLVSALVLAPTLAFAATTVVGGIDTSGNGFLGISFGDSSIANCSATICGIGETILYLINSVLVPVLFAIAFIVFIYGVAKAYIFSGGDSEAVSQGHRLILYGLIGFVVMLSLWGLVNVVSNTFGLAGGSAPDLPTSY